MNFFKWKDLLITSAVCLVPIIVGIVIWDKLPEVLATHFDISNNPNGFSNKGFAVFGMPVIMMLLQGFCCFVTDLNVKKHGVKSEFEAVTKWIIPIITVVLQLAIFGIALGKNIDIRIVSALIVGCMFLVIGRCLPKLDYVKNYNFDAEKARKINRFIGVETVIMGILFLISIFLPPIATVVCIFALIPYGIIGAIYGIKVGRK